MGVHIWHFTVLALCIFIDFRVDAVTSSDDFYISDTLENITTVVNNTIILTCPKNDSDIRWKYFNGTVWQILPIHSNKYEFIPSSYTDKGIYVCFYADTSIKKFNVTVYEPPYFIKKNSMKKIVVKPAGNMVKLQCRASGYPPPNITWSRDEKSPPTRKLGEIKINHRALTLEDLVPADKGNYTCNVCNIVGCISFTYSVDVVERYHNTPILTTGLENMTVTLHENVTLNCQFVSDLHPFIVWTKLPLNYSNCSYEEPRDCNATNLQTTEESQVDPEVYQIYNVTHEDEGWYACFASNSLGTTVSRAYLKVVDEQPGSDFF